MAETLIPPQQTPGAFGAYVKNVREKIHVTEPEGKGWLIELSGTNEPVDIPTPKQKLIHVHPGSEELGRIYQPALAIQATRRSAFRAPSGYFWKSCCSARAFWLSTPPASRPGRSPSGSPSCCTTCCLTIAFCGCSNGE